MENMSGEDGEELLLMGLRAGGSGVRWRRIYALPRQVCVGQSSVVECHCMDTRL